MKNRLMQFSAGAALAAGMLLGQTPAPAPQPGQGPGARMMRNRPQRLARLANYLNLTPDQRDQAKAILEQAKAAAQPILAQVKAGREQLANAVKSGASDADIDRLSIQQGVLNGQLIAIRTKAMGKVYAILTPDQRQKADQLRNRLQQLFQQGFQRNG